MKVKDLLKEINAGKKEYKDFLDFDVYIQVVEGDNLKDKKRKDNNWKFIEDSEHWEYIECAGFHTTFPKEKIFTINADY